MTSTAPAVGIATGGNPVPGTSRAGRRRRRGTAALRRTVSPLALLALWQAASATGVLPEDKLAPPLQIFDAMAEEWHKGTLQAATGISLQRVAIGFALGASVALVLAAVAGLSRVGDDVVDPPMQMLRTLPHFGLIPLFILWMGIGEEPKIALIALGVLFPLYLNTFAGIRGIDRRNVEAARAMNLTRLQRIRHVIIPGALPQTLTGLRYGLGIAWLSLIVAETISASSGLGYMINQAREFLQTDVIVVGLAVYALLGLLTDSLVRLLERKALAWRV
jgi:sulfonate transport system permease protein